MVRDKGGHGGGVLPPRLCGALFLSSCDYALTQAPPLAVLRDAQESLPHRLLRPCLLYPYCPTPLAQGYTSAVLPPHTLMPLLPRAPAPLHIMYYTTKALHPYMTAPQHPAVQLLLPPYGPGDAVG